MADAAFYNDDVFQTMTITPRAFPQMDLLDVRVHISKKSVFIMQKHQLTYT